MGTLGLRWAEEARLRKLLGQRLAEAITLVRNPNCKKEHSRMNPETSDITHIHF
jgi:hypothetical protein